MWSCKHIVHVHVRLVATYMYISLQSCFEICVVIEYMYMYLYNVVSALSAFYNCVFLHMDMYIQWNL